MIRIFLIVLASLQADQQATINAKHFQKASSTDKSTHASVMAVIFSEDSHSWLTGRLVVASGKSRVEVLSRVCVYDSTGSVIADFTERVSSYDNSLRSTPLRHNFRNGQDLKSAKMTICFSFDGQPTCDKCADPAD